MPPSICFAVTPDPDASCANVDQKYVGFAIDWLIKVSPYRDMIDPTKIYTSGFSQNGMFAVQTQVCQWKTVRGAWAGGAGMYDSTRLAPRPPNGDGQGHADCRYFPAYPCTIPLGASHLIDEKPTVCLQTYLDDPITTALASGPQHNHARLMFEAMQAERTYDVVALEFRSGKGGHSPPVEHYSWVASCLNIPHAATGLHSECPPACRTLL